MAVYELVLRKDSPGEMRFPVADRGLIIGRGPESDVVLSSSLVSRRHAQVWVEGDFLFVKDLGSRNGITINGERFEQAGLNAGDRLGVGDHFFEIAKRDDISRSSVITREKADSLYEEMVQEGGTGRLPILYKAAQLLGAVFDLNELLDRILATIFEAVPAERGFILTVSEATNEPVIRAERSRGTDGDEPPLSTTLVQQVMSQKSAVLTVDAQEDERFDGAASVVQHAIHSAMCAPLFGQRSVVGAIYLDSGPVPLPFEDGDLELLTAIGRVVGVAVENAQLYRENVQRERLAAIGQATAGVGHCMKNILTGIKGGAQFIDRAIEESDFKWLEKGWPILSRCADRLEMLVLNLLTFSRDRTPQRAPTDINGLIEEVLAVVRSRAERLGVSLDFRKAEGGVVQVDGREIYRMLLNLVTNAVDACEKSGGSVKVRYAADQDGCSIKVKDNGVGIPEEARGRLFQAFATTKGSSGTGLGLACSRKIVEEHGGTITIKSKVGKGTGVTVCLPNPSMDETKT